MTETETTPARRGREAGTPIEPGMRFGMWEAISHPETTYIGGIKRLLVRCRCDCGTEKLVDLYNLIRGLSGSCGCRLKELRRTNASKHGLSKHPLFQVWMAMVARCTNPEHPSWKDYGGRGIHVCDRWLDPVAFFEDVLPLWRLDLTFDRCNNDGHYKPGNVRFVDRKTQQRNKRDNVLITFHGRTMCLTEWAEELGMDRDLLHSRIRRDWPPERALTAPSSRPRRS